MFQVNPLLGRGFDLLKNQALFSSKDKSKKIKCRLLQFLHGALRVMSPLLVGQVTSCFDPVPWIFLLRLISLHCITFKTHLIGMEFHVGAIVLNIFKKSPAVNVSCKSKK